MNRPDQFSPDDVTVLKESADIIADQAEEVGYQIIQMILNMSPVLKQVFPFMNTKDVKRQREGMKNLAVKYVQVLTSFVECIGDQRKLSSLYSRLLKAHNGLDELQMSTHWGVFTESTIYTIRQNLGQTCEFCDAEALDNAVTLWRRVIREIVHNMKAAFSKRKERSTTLEAQGECSTSKQECCS